METISSYLDNMFLSLPRTKEVIQAKQELLQMMEDKYTELKAEGKTENEAVGIVISEFGNLEEIAESLGISDVVNPEMDADQEENKVEERVSKRVLSFEDTKLYLKLVNKRSNLIATGVFLCITSVTGGTLCDMLISLFGSEDEMLVDAIASSMLFVFIAVAVGLFVFASMLMKDYEWVDKNWFVTDFETKAYVEAEEKEYRYKHILYMVFGIMFCVLCFVPAIILNVVLKPEYGDSLSGFFLFVFVGIGVFLIVKTTIKEAGYERILKEEYSVVEKIKGEGNTVKRSNVKKVMDIYYSTITCIYLCWSFITFDWNVTWIIWPIAWVLSFGVKAIAKAICDKEES